jgi:adenylosuccinate synthase
MGATAIVGANWGDEGKGKITDLLAGEADIVVRFQGGRNAGHTVINDYGKFALHLLPCGVFRPNVVNVLGPGVALDIAAFLDELDALVAAGVPRPHVVVSERAQVVMPYHTALDAYEEERLGGAGFGSTKAGIAPFYADKYLKLGVQVADLYDADVLRGRIEHSLAAKNVVLTHLYRKAPYSCEAVVSELSALAKRLRPFVCDTTTLLYEALQSGRRILLEGQLGSLRDPDHGIYPFPTSSSPLAGFACVGAGVPPWAIRSILCVVKAYSTCVGAGPFVTELAGEEAQRLRARGGSAGEYGATTGRPRRVGWFDAVATRYGCRVQGATEAALTLLDVLGYLDSIPICTGYEIDGQRVTDFPVTRLLYRASPVYETLQGWRCDISGIRDYNDLPPEARLYVETLERLIGVPITRISVGPQRCAVICRPIC